MKKKVRLVLPFSQAQSTSENEHIASETTDAMDMIYKITRDRVMKNVGLSGAEVDDMFKSFDYTINELLDEGYTIDLGVLGIFQKTVRNTSFYNDQGVERWMEEETIEHTPSEVQLEMEEKRLREQK